MKNESPEYPYLYCFVRGSEPQTFTSKGMGDRGDAVTSIHYKDLGAVISTSPVREYDSNRRNMMTHTRVQEEVMERYSILPVRFNTVAPDADKMHRLLKDRYDEFQSLLDHMAGKVEMGLKALWYEGIIFDEILAENPDILRLRDALQGRSEEKSYYDRIRLGELVENAVRQKRRDEEWAILKALRPYVCEEQANKIIGDRMILNGAFLVERERGAELDAAVQALDVKMGHRILFRYVGPIGPYNFVNVVITWDKYADALQQR